jgi:hypothetical protein
MDEIDVGLARRTTILTYCVAQRWAWTISRRAMKQQNMQARLGVQIRFAKTSLQASKVSLRGRQALLHACVR